MKSQLRSERKHNRRRASTELGEHERWNCPFGCGKFFRSTSTRSVRRHRENCPIRPSDAHIAVIKNAIARYGYGTEDEVFRSIPGLQQIPYQVLKDQINGHMEASSSRLCRRPQRRRRDNHELEEFEKWYCPNTFCGKFYKKTSTRSITRHIQECVPTQLQFNPELEEAEVRLEDDGQSANTSDDFSMVDDDHVTADELVIPAQPSLATLSSAYDLLFLSKAGNSPVKLKVEQVSRSWLPPFHELHVGGHMATRHRRC